MTSKNLLKIQPFGRPLQRRRFSENPYKTLAVRTKIKVRALKKLKKTPKNRFQDALKKKIAKNTSKTGLGTHLGLQNPSKIQEKTFEKRREKKLRKKNEKMTSQSPIKKPVLARNGKREDMLE